MDQLLTRSKILNNKPELNFRASESLYKIDPGNPDAIKALINLSCWYISAWCTYDNAISLLQQIGLHESEAISELRKKLQSDNESVRGAAAEIFAKVEPNNQEAIDTLIELLCKGSQIMCESEDFFTSDKTTEIGEDYRNHAEQALIAVGVDNLIIINKLINLLYSNQENETSLRISNILAKIGTGNLNTTIAVYKFSSLSREEVEAMLGLTLEQTRVYQEAKAEGREEGREERETEMLKLAVPLLLKTGMSVELIAQQLNVDVEAVRLAVQENT